MTSPTEKTKTWSAAWGGTRVVALVVCCVLVFNATAFAGHRKMSKDLDVASLGATPVDVIVQYKTTPNSKHLSKAQGRGALVKKQLGLINAVTYSVPADQIQGMIDDESDITYVTPDRPVSGASFTDAFVAVNADLAQSYGYDGTGVGVAIIDSGIGNNPDLKFRVAYSQDFTNSGTTDDIYGHGTHVSGIVAGQGYQSQCKSCFLNYMGVAPGARLINLKALDNNGGGTDSSVIAAIQAAINLKSRYNIRVINLSLGRGIYESYTTDPLTQAVEQAWKSGIFVVVAAGNYGRDNSNNNNGYGTIASPGNDPYAITVGAMRTMGTSSRADDAIASYSSKGPSMLDHVVKPDIVAPGNLITSTLGQNATLETVAPSTQLPNSAFMYGGTGYSTYYFTLSGTSMAAPMVSGAAALLFQQNPYATPDQVKAKLMKTAYKNLPLYTSATDSVTGITYYEQADIFTVGAGYLDIAAALSNNDFIPSWVGNAQSPKAVFNSATGEVTLVNGASVLWGNSVLWGTSVVWGNSVLWGTNASGQSVLWGSSVCWGSSTNSGFSVLWGTSTSPMSVLWGSSVLWGTNSVDSSSVVVNGDN